MPRTLRPGRTIVPGEASVTRGMISAFRYDSIRDAQLVQTDAAINPGNSGGPLFSNCRAGRGYEHVWYFLADELITWGSPFLETTITEKLRIWNEGPDAEFGPVSGDLPHEVDEYIEVWSPDFEATDDEFAVSAPSSIPTMRILTPKHGTTGFTSGVPPIPTTSICTS